MLLTCLCHLSTVSFPTLCSPKSALDAPVVLPPWNPDATALDVEAEIGGITGPLGDALQRLQAGGVEQYAITNPQAPEDGHQQQGDEGEGEGHAEEGGAAGGEGGEGAANDNASSGTTDPAASVAGTSGQSSSSE